MLRNIFQKRKILIITDEKITSLPLASSVQFGLSLFLVALIAWSSYSSGQYIANKQLLREKEREVQQASLVNLDLQTKVDNLQGNLVRMNHYFQTVKNLDHVKIESQTGEPIVSDVKKRLKIKIPQSNN